MVAQRFNFGTARKVASKKPAAKKAAKAPAKRSASPTQIQARKVDEMLDRIERKADVLLENADQLLRRFA